MSIKERSHETLAMSVGFHFYTWTMMLRSMFPSTQLMSVPKQRLHHSAKPTLLVQLLTFLVVSVCEGWGKKKKTCQQLSS